MSGIIDAAAGLFYRFAASGSLPASWFRDLDPAGVPRARRTGKLSLEIVSHCWRYGHFLTYQLSSLVNHRTDKLDVTMTVYHAPGDEPVLRVLRFFEDIDVPGVTWCWRPLPEGRLFRRSIGRNLAAKATRADWVWFTDVDVVFHQGCLDTLADLLQGRDDALVHPRSPLGTALLPEDHELLTQGRAAPAVRDIPLEAFRPYGGNHDRAKGPYQITHGDMARAVGYCESHRPLPAAGAALAQGLRGPRVPLAPGHRRHGPRHPGLLPDPPCRQGTVPGRLGRQQAALLHTQEPRPASTVTRAGAAA